MITRRLALAVKPEIPLGGRRVGDWTLKVTVQVNRYCEAPNGAVRCCNSADRYNASFTLSEYIVASSADLTMTHLHRHQSRNQHRRKELTGEGFEDRQ